MKIGKLPKRVVQDNPSTTPYDMLNVSVGDMITVARPYEVVIDKDTKKEYPSKACTSCPHCGHGIFFDVRQDLLLSNKPLIIICGNCNAGGEKPPEIPIELFIDPFCHPIESGIVSRSEISSFYSDIKSFKVDDTRTAAEIVKERRRDINVDNSVLEMGEEAE